MYDNAIFIGRFQIPHLGHLHIIESALKEANTLTIIIGSANAPRSIRNPFYANEREEMLRNAINPDLIHRITFEYVEDSMYNDAKWINDVQNIADKKSFSFNVLVGHRKDNTSYYLGLFPHWDNISFPNYKGINSTDIRNDYFNLGIINPNVHPSTDRFLFNFAKTKDYQNIKNELDFINKYKKSWENAPYPPTFVTVDACVVQGGHVLLVRRGASPGKGLFALPGGFINQDERIEDAVLRELREETGIKVPDPVLRGSIILRKVFDDPNRSSRGRTITHAHLIKLDDRDKLPKVKGADDADKAFWYPFAKLRPNDFFEDHYFMSQNLISTI